MGPGRLCRGHGDDDVSAADLAAVIVTGVCFAVVVVLVLAVISMVRTMRELRATVDELRQAALPMVEDLRGTVARAGAELDRVDGVIGRAERISTTVDHASRLTYRAFAPPLIKGLALVSGVGRAARRFRRRRTRRAIEVTGQEHDSRREHRRKAVVRGPYDGSREVAAGRPHGNGHRAPGRSHGDDDRAAGRL